MLGDSIRTSEITERDLPTRKPEAQGEKNKLQTGCFGARGGVFHQCISEPRETNIIAYEDIEDRSCWFRIPKLSIRLNPVVTLLANAIIWSFVIWCMVDPEGSGKVFTGWRTQITKKFTWLYIGSQDLWALFVAMLYFSKYSNAKLGKDDDVPEYSTASWFTMLFAAGLGSGIFYFAVSEPIWHYDLSGGGGRYNADGYMPDNTLAQWSLTLSLYHWGIHGWVVFNIVGLLMAFVGYRLGLPLTIKSCFYPLIGDKIFGWIGDIIDVMSIVTTLFGVCTSLGLGAIQINTGLNLMNPIIESSDVNSVIIIWVITAIATTSTLSGIGFGIRRLSEISFGVGLILMLILLFLSNTWYLLNLYIQSLGFYFQWILQLSFHTDAFEQLGPSYGGENRGREFPDGTSDGPEDWMTWWTIFYWGWWIGFSPFVGMFIAKISKGRTIRQFINGTMTAPIVYVFLWLTVFGGVSLQIERDAAAIGLCCNANFNKTINSTWDLSNQNIGDWVCENNTCNQCAGNIISLADRMDINNGTEFLTKVQEEEFGITIPNKTLTRLSCHGSTEMWFDVMNSFNELGPFVSVFSIIGLVLYFVTSSDSGSIVIDCLAANGDEDPPRIQRAFWALTEGATATALIWVGGRESLSNLQTLTVVAGLPYTFLLCFMCISLWRALAVDAGDIDPYGPQFPIGLFDVFARPTMKNIGNVLLNIFIAPYSFARAIAHTGDDGKWKKCQLVAYTIILYMLLVGFILLHIAVIWIEEIWAVAWVCYLAFTGAGGAARVSLRNKYGINGNMIEDMFCSFLLYPVTAYQLSKCVDHYSSQSADLESHTNRVSDIPANVIELSAYVHDIEFDNRNRSEC